MDIKQVIRDYLPNTMHMSLATVHGAKPWVSEVHFVYDDELNLYFRSKPSRRHSQEIAINPNVAGNIVVQHALHEPAKAVYFEGKAVMLESNDQIERIAKFFKQRLQLDEQSIADPEHMIYKITVYSYYFFGSLGGEPAQKHELQWNEG